MPGNNNVPGPFCGCNVASYDKNLRPLTQELLEVCPQSPVRQFIVVPWCRSSFPGYVVLLFPESFWDRQFSTYYYWYHFIFTFHIHCVSIARSFHFQIFFGFFLDDISLFLANAMSIKKTCSFSQPRIIRSSLLLQMAVSLSISISSSSPPPPPPPPLLQAVKTL
jgi:hypothetical protein